jgi:hypothetical protein
MAGAGRSRPVDDRIKGVTSCAARVRSAKKTGTLQYADALEPRLKAVQK